MTRPIRIAITTGDTDGIGLEICAKALSKIKPCKGVQFYLWRSTKASKKELKRIDSQFKRVTVGSWPEALKKDEFDYKQIIDISSDLSPAHWVEISAKAALFNHIDAIATAPLSKLTIKEAGMEDIGHTDILKRVTKSKNLFMCFIGKYMNVVLATGHIGINKISEELSSLKLFKASLAANSIRALTGNKKDKPIAIVGLNPHAGENGLIGDEERKLYKTLFKKLDEAQINYNGPIVPDVAYNEEMRKKHSIYVAPYHDQGLIPFKMLHGQDSGVHITLGLPFIRTSVDHGTAKDIFGKNKAKPESMIEAIEWSINLAKNAIKDGNITSSKNWK